MSKKPRLPNSDAAWSKLPDAAPLCGRWHDPDTGKRKSQSAKTAGPDEAEDARADLESDLNNGRHKQAARMSWEKFRELFDAEYVSGLREDTRDNYADTFDAFERLSRPETLRGVTERTLSSFDRLDHDLLRERR